MFIDPILYYIILVAFAAVSALAIYLLVIHSVSSKKSEQKDKNLNPQAPLVNKQSDEINLRAQRDYQAIVSAANKRAQEIIEEAIQVRNNSQEIFNATLSEIISKQKEQLNSESANLSQVYNESLKKLNSDNINILTNASNEFLKYAEGQIEGFKKSIAQQTFESENLAREKIEQEYTKLQTELAKYREDYFKKIEDNIYNILLNVSKDVIGKSLDLTTHEQLITESLDKAKKDLAA